MKFGLKEDVLANICKVFSFFSERDKAIIYGSRAKGNYKNGSDIDLTLFGEKLNLSVINKISLQLDELFCLINLTFLIFHQLSNIELIEHINIVGKIFYTKTR